MVRLRSFLIATIGLLACSSAAAQSLPPAPGPIQIMRGPDAHLPTLLAGQPAVTYTGSDATNHYSRFYVGSSAGNILMVDTNATGSSGVPSINGVTSAVSLIAGTGINVSTASPNITVSLATVAGSATTIGYPTSLTFDIYGRLQSYTAGSAPPANVSSLNSLTGAVVLAAGANVSFSTSGNTITIAAAGSSGTSGVSSVNAMTGAINIAAGTNVTTSSSGGTVTINSNAVSSFNGSGGAVTLAAVTPLILIPGGSTNSLTFSSSGVTAGTYTDPNVTFDSYGRATTASNGTVDRDYITTLSGPSHSAYLLPAPSSASVRRVYYFLDASAGNQTVMLQNVNAYFALATEIEFYVQRIDTTTNTCILYPSNSVASGHPANTIAGQSSVSFSPAPSGTKTGTAYRLTPYDVDNWAQM